MSRSRLLIAAAALILVVSVGAYVAYDQILSGDSVAPLALPTTPPNVAASPGAGASAAPLSSAQAGRSGGSATGPAGNVSGTWTVAAGSQAGYRVRERLANLPAESDAVGRTSDVTGSITVESSGATTTLTGGNLTVNTTTIASDESRRDNRLRSEGLQTDAFPTATFTITTPVEVPAAAPTGTASDITLSGDLTLHGVKRPVSIPAQVRLVDGTIQVAGSIGVALSDYDIVAPNIGGFVISIADQGTLEFQVNFTKS